MMIKGQTNIFDFIEDKKNYTYTSAFSGIGGMTMGLKDLGFECLVAWEFDPTSKRQYAAEAHKLLHPEIEVQGDICSVDTSKVPNMDLFCFTPPCQAFSVAGKRGGFDDTRGTLTFEALRIVKDKKPKILFMENVKGLVNHDKGKTLGVIISAINEIGYTVDFNVLNSKYFDVPQNRERVYLIAIRNDLIKTEPWNNVKGNTMLPKAKKKYMSEGAVTFNFNWPKQNQVRTILKDLLEQDVPDKYYLDEEKTKNLILYSDKKLVIKEATKKGFSEALEGDSVNIAFPNSNTRRGRVGKQIANTIEASGVNQGVVIKVADLNHYGNDIMNRIYSAEGISATLVTVSGGGREQKIMSNDLRVRKLTPREYLRLQSVKESDIDKLLENFSDIRCYKFAGNGLTTNVIKAIGKEIRKMLEGFE